jgi:hypothetical protein
MSKFYNSSLDRTPNTGGSVRMTIASNIAQGNDGVSLPCKRVWLMANNKEVRVNIGSTCTAITGMQLPYIDGATYRGDPLMLEIDDVSSLHFYCGSDGRVIDCLYRE